MVTAPWWDRRQDRRRYQVEDRRQDRRRYQLVLRLKKFLKPSVRPRSAARRPATLSPA